MHSKATDGEDDGDDGTELRSGVEAKKYIMFPPLLTFDKLLMA